MYAPAVPSCEDEFFSSLDMFISRCLKQRMGFSNDGCFASGIQPLSGRELGGSDKRLNGVVEREEIPLPQYM